MDFTLDPAAAAVSDVADDVVKRLLPDWETKFADSGFDAAAWRGFVDAGVTAMPLSEEFGGDDLGVDALRPLVVRAGRDAVVTPLIGTLAAGLVGASTDPEGRFAVAVGEPGRALGEGLSTTLVDGVLTGVKTGVLHADGATALVVAAAGGIAVVDPAADGVTVTRTTASSGWGEYTVRFDRARAGRVVSDDPQPLVDVYRALLAAYADGLLAGAIARTAEHVSTRHQFGKPIATFQAVGQQLADVYVISATLGLVSTAAAWELAQSRDAQGDLATAMYWIASELPATMRTMTHLHGGIGVDVTYPLHRYFSITKDLGRLVGGADRTLAVLADTDPAGSGTGADAGDGMFIAFTEAQLALRDELRTYFSTLISDDDARTMRVERHGPAYRKVIKQMGADGWLGVGWPAEFGGKGFGEIEQQIFTNEAVRADVPLPSVTLQTVGPTLQKYGTQEQKDLFLPRILAGDVHFAIGYTEPDAGTDLASLTTRATLDETGENYIVNGQKIFTTGGHDADYIWLACRTDQDAPKHKGITILILDTRDPGFTWTPIITADGAHHVNATYYSDVKVPVSMRVGEEGDGWKLITTQLNHERVMLGPSGRIGGVADKVRDWAATAQVDGEPVSSRDDVRRALATIGAYERLNELLNWQVASSGEISMASAAATKVFATERVQTIHRMADEIVGRYGDFTDETTADLVDWLDMMAKRNAVITFGGGVNEVMRDMIGTAGLGLPRVKR
ncbi:acyl-CoA dehydrogenase [Gordonia malaquae]|uniref:acyl-CoA dehydrogenase n=1 Tax=Gordonia malaquae TaxID=410332 RepID=UPI00301795BF